MKFFAFILSFYVLVLTAMPCIDVHQDNVTHKTEVSQNSQNTHHHSDADNCSPFCTCNCCATPMVCQMEQVDLQVSVIVREHITSYPTLLVTQRSGDIWQPPQLS